MVFVLPSNGASESANVLPSKFYVDLKRVELEPPAQPLRSEEELKEWVWENHSTKMSRRSLRKSSKV